MFGRWSQNTETPRRFFKNGLTAITAYAGNSQREKAAAALAAAVAFADMSQFIPAYLKQQGMKKEGSNEKKIIQRQRLFFH